MSTIKEKMSVNNMGSDVKIVGFSVVLVANSNNPSIMNPDFLRYNGIVDVNRQIQGDPITIPGFSQVKFEGGLTVQAEPNRVIFEQVGDPLATEDDVCPKMASDYLQKVPHVSYSAVGINPKGYRTSDAEAPERISTALLDKGEWMTFKNVCPDIYLKTIYRYENEKRMIVLDIAELKNQGESGVEIPGILFQANIHHDISATNQQTRIAMVSKILSSWKEDLSDFVDLVAKFNFGSIAS